MPIYEYTCTRCDHAFEHLHRTLSDPAPDCPKCGAPRPRKELSAFSAATGSGDGLPCAEGTCPSTGACSPSACPASKCPF